MLQFGLRLGDWPRQLVTTTPRPTPLLKELIADPATALARALTRDNAANLAPSFLETMIAQYAGTRLGRQELEGEMIEERKDALWTREMIESLRVKESPPLARIVVAVDPPASSGKRADNCGIVAAGIDATGSVHVLDDATLAAARPAQWARAAIALYHPWCGRRAANICAPRRWRSFTNRSASNMSAPFRRWKTKCATSVPTASPPDAVPTGSTRWSGR